MACKKKAISESKVVLQKCERCGDEVPVLFLSRKDGKKICSRCLKLESLPSGEAS